MEKNNTGIIKGLVMAAVVLMQIIFLYSCVSYISEADGTYPGGKLMWTVALLVFLPVFCLCVNNYYRANWKKLTKPDIIVLALGFLPALLLSIFTDITPVEVLFVLAECTSLITLYLFCQNKIKYPE